MHQFSSSSQPKSQYSPLGHGKSAERRDAAAPEAEHSQPQHPLSGAAPATALLTSSGMLQTKLEISAANDPLEHEADAMADRVMRMPLSGATFEGASVSAGVSASASASGAHIQRKCAACEQEEKIQPKSQSASAGAGHASPQLSSQIQSTRGQGHTMDPQTRNHMEQGFGRDFSGVRIHTGEYAHQMNQELGARAFTVGSDVYFRQGEYQPGAESGRRLMAHELAHTVQQGAGILPKRIQRAMGDGHDLLSERFQGRLNLEAAFDEERMVKKGEHSPDVVILQLALLDAGEVLPIFGADGRFEQETEAAVRSFQASHGLLVDGIAGPRTMEALDALFTVGPVIAPVCANPGVARTVTLQPVFIKCGVADADPTGGAYFGMLTKANEIWSKLGVTFVTNAPVVLDDCTNKTVGTTRAERDTLRGLHAGAGVEVVFADNDLAAVGGGATISAGDASAIALSDFGTSDTLLAHELGHVLGLDHPPVNGDPGTIMDPSGSHSIPNPERNTLANVAFITFPAGIDPICLTPDP